MRVIKKSTKLTKAFASIKLTETDDKVSIDMVSDSDEFGTLTLLAYTIDAIIREHNLNRSIVIDTLADLIADLGNYGKLVFDAKDYNELKNVPKSDIDEPIDDTYDQSWINQG